MKLLPPVWLMITIAIMGILHACVPVHKCIPDDVALVGMVPLIFGICLVLSAAGRFRKANTPIKPFEESTALVVEGPFRFTRNPMYLGMTVILVGVAFLFGSATPWLTIPFFVWVVQTQYILKEEPFMEERFGEAYREYKNRVRRWV